MATVVQTFTATPAGSATSATVTPSVPVASGDRILLAVTSSTGVPTSIVDQSSRTFTLDASIQAGASSAAYVSLWRLDTTASVTDITVTLASAGYFAVRGWDLTGFAPGGPDASATANGAGANGSVGPTAATSQASEFVVALLAIPNNPSISGETIDSSSTGVVVDGTLVGGSYQVLLDTAYLNVSNAGAQSAAASFPSNDWAMIVAAYKDAAAPTVIPPRPLNWPQAMWRSAYR